MSNAQFWVIDENGFGFEMSTREAAIDYCRMYEATHRYTAWAVTLGIINNRPAFSVEHRIWPPEPS